MKNLINIEIKDSFNRESDSQKKNEATFNNASTLNKQNDSNEISSMSIGSVTASQLQDDFKIISRKKSKNDFWKQISVNVISCVIGTVLGALIMYLIFGIK